MCRASTCTNRPPVGQPPAPDGPALGPRAAKSRGAPRNDCPVPSPALGAPPHLNAKSRFPQLRGAGFLLGAAARRRHKLGRHRGEPRCEAGQCVQAAGRRQPSCARARSLSSSRMRTVREAKEMAPSCSNALRVRMALEVLMFESSASSRRVSASPIAWWLVGLA